MRFVTDDGDVLVDEGVATLRYTFPWYYFGGALKVRRRKQGRAITITFTPDARARAAGNLGNVVDAIGTGREWRRVLAKAKRPQRAGDSGVDESP